MVEQLLTAGLVILSAQFCVLCKLLNNSNVAQKRAEKMQDRSSRMEALANKWDEAEEQKRDLKHHDGYSLN